MKYSLSYDHLANSVRSITGTGTEFLSAATDIFRPSLRRVGVGPYRRSAGIRSSRRSKQTNRLPIRTVINGPAQTCIDKSMSIYRYVPALKKPVLAVVGSDTLLYFCTLCNLKRYTVAYQNDAYRLFFLIRLEYFSVIFINFNKKVPISIIESVKNLTFLVNTMVPLFIRVKFF